MSVEIQSAASTNFIHTAPTQFTATLDAGATNVSSNVGYWHRWGRYMIANGVITYSGSGGDSATWIITIPNGKTVDVAYLGSGATYTNPVGMYVCDIQFWDQSGGAMNQRQGFLASATTIKIVDSGGTTYTNVVFDSGDGVKYWIRVPIVGWS